MRKTQRSEIRVLALYPPAKGGRDVAEYSFLTEEFRALARRGIKIFSVSTQAPSSYQRDGVTIYAVPRSGKDPTQVLANVRFALSARRFFPWPRLWRLRDWYRIALIERYAVDVARREGVDLIHSTFAWPSGSAGMLAKKATGKPLLLSLRGADILTDASIGYGGRLDRFYDALLRRALQQADRITGNSRYVLEKARELGADRRKYVLVAKGVDIAKFVPAARSNGVPERLQAYGRPMVLSVRHLRPKQGLEYLIRAARLVADKMPRVLFVICGGGREPYQGQLKALVRELGLQDHVTFTGQVSRDEVADYFAACDVSVIPSVAEAAGNVILEAMACAKPVVGTRVGGIPEYLEDGVSGVLAEPRDPAALAEKILLLLADKELAQRMGQAGRERVERHFRFETMIGQIEGLYRELAALPSQSGRG